MTNLVYGTMSLHLNAMTEFNAADWLTYVYDSGIRYLHVSSEYESYPFFLNVLKRLPQYIKFKFVVKVAEPHFDKVSFDKKRLEKKLDDYRNDLNTPCLNVVQYMWRGNLKDGENERIDNFNSQNIDLLEFIKSQKQFNKLDEFYIFPYSLGFLKSAVKSQIFDGYSVYLNPLEYDLANVVKNEKLMGIRPFYAGKVLKEKTVQESFQFALKYSPKYLVFSTGNKNHLNDIFELNV